METPRNLKLVSFPRSVRLPSAGGRGSVVVSGAEFELPVAGNVEMSFEIAVGSGLTFADGSRHMKLSAFGSAGRQRMTTRWALKASRSTKTVLVSIMVQVRYAGSERGISRTTIIVVNRTRIAPITFENGIRGTVSSHDPGVKITGLSDRSSPPGRGSMKRPETRKYAAPARPGGARERSTKPAAKRSAKPAAKRSATPAGESRRFTDLTLYEGARYDSDDLTKVSPLPDDHPLSAGGSYTLTVAIRKKRIGVSAKVKTPRAVQPRRKEKEAIEVFVLARALFREVELTDSFAKLRWAYDEDSSAASLRFSVPPFAGAKARKEEIEVRLYDTSLDLLDVVVLSIELQPQAGARRRTAARSSLHWPKTPLNAGGPQAPPRLVSIAVAEKPGGYELDFVFRNSAEDEIRVQFVRNITYDDLKKLLDRVRNFWTSLVITNYAKKLDVSATTYGKYIDQLRDLGVEAWHLLFGDRFADQQGTSERVGKLLAGYAGSEGERIQVVHNQKVSTFVFPWSILYPPTASGEPVDPLRFWGARFQLEQVEAGRGPELRLDDEPVNVTFMLDPGFGNSATQRAMFAEYTARAPQVKVSEPVTREDELLRHLTTVPAAHLLYFFCHGYAAGRPDGMAADGVKRLTELIEKITGAEGAEDAKDVEARAALQTLLDLTKRMGEESWIFIGDSEVKESALQGHDFFLVRRPIVILNMCQSAQLLPSMSDGFVRLFLRHNASAVIGTESPMTAVFAEAFAKEMFDALFSGNDIGTALLKTRRHFLSPERRNPLALAYTLYGRATATVGAHPLLPTAATPRRKTNE